MNPDAHQPVPRLSQELRHLHQLASGRDLSLREIETELQGRGTGVFILVLTLPFLIPIPNPTSTIFGAAILFLGLRLMLNIRSLLPAFILDRKVPHQFLEKVALGSAKVCGWLEKFSKPRLPFFHSWPAMRAVIGFGIMGGAFVLALPVVVPNILPASSILLLTAGLMEEDGLFVLFGYLIGILCWIYLALLYCLGREGLQAMLHHLF